MLNITNYNAPDRANEISDNEQTPTDFVYIVNMTAASLFHRSSLDLHEVAPLEQQTVPAHQTFV